MYPESSDDGVKIRYKSAASLSLYPDHGKQSAPPSVRPLSHPHPSPNARRAAQSHPKELQQREWFLIARRIHSLSCIAADTPGTYCHYAARTDQVRRPLQLPYSTPVLKTIVGQIQVAHGFARPNAVAYLLFD